MKSQKNSNNNYDTLLQNNSATWLSSFFPCPFHNRASPEWDTLKLNLCRAQGALSSGLRSAELMSVFVVPAVKYRLPLSCQKKQHKCREKSGNHVVFMHHMIISDLSPWYVLSQNAEPITQTFWHRSRGDLCLAYMRWSLTRTPYV